MQKYIVIKVPFWFAVQESRQIGIFNATPMKLIIEI
jgi:hypothetical protein